MKKIYLTFSCILLSLILQAQYNSFPLSEIQQYPQKESDKVTTTSGNRVVIWSEDFAGGWPAGWTIDDASGISPWKWTMGGSWGYFNGNTATAAGTPIASTTAANGFLINDADSANHFTYGQPSGTNYQYLSTYFTTTAINTTGYPNVLLEFQQYFRFNNSIDLEVHVSNDSINWTQYNVQGAAVNNTASANPETVSLNISPVAGNQATVYLRFGWNARVYYWMLDDIQLIEAPNDDMKLANANYENATLNSFGYPIKYTMVPVSQVAPITFRGALVNQGGNAQTNVMMNIDVRDATSSYFTGSSTSVSLNPSDTNYAEVLGYTPASAIQDYDFIYEVNYTNAAMDATPENNKDTLPFMVTSYEYARDKNSYSSGGLWNGAGEPYLMGNTYQFVNDFILNTVRVAFSAGTDSMVLAYVEVFEIDPTTGDFVSILTTSGTSMEKTILSSDISAGGIIKWVDLEVPDITLLSGMEYVITVGHYGGPEDMTIMNGNTSQPQTTFLLDGTTWYYMTNTPMIRAVFNPAIGTDEITTGSFVGNPLPNPSDNMISVPYSISESAEVTITVTDITGKQMISENLGSVAAGENRYAFDVSQYSPGIYFCTVAINGSAQTKKLVVK